MKNVAIVGALLAVFALPASPAGAVGCFTGGIAGGVAGHYAGHHGFLGAVGGCLAGHALHKKQMAERRLRHQQEMHPARPAPAGPAQQP
ncbi:hypothetical protein C7I85_01075 [Mesorhizobium soli]|uniref:Glycine zipper 2TM domain-containing protein n=1 Tax=Pseudaminobacter soli (ex Li et al. 2025) TaxID=1295366 RepID=A0A2P7SMV6_9HYPH|nr:hypothetical protein C7I85_01075 [Mesorhizobium soli]